MEISFELPGEVDVERLNRFMLPVGYVAEQVLADAYRILSEDKQVQVGVCYFEDPFVTVTFFENTEDGRLFTIAFGREHPECDPKKEMFGVVYQIPPDGLFHLDVMPMKNRKEALKSIKNYVALEKAYFVSFRRGDWTQTALKVINMRKIYFDGSLGEKEITPLFLPLENNPPDKETSYSKVPRS